MADLSPDAHAAAGGALALRTAADGIRTLRDAGFVWTVDEIVQYLDDVADSMEELQP